MKKVKLMALGLMVMMIQSVGAVTLPSTSYSPYSSGTSSSGSEGVVFSSGSMVTGSYQSLGAITAVTDCQGSGPDIPPEGYSDCEECCDDLHNIRDCMAGGGSYADCSSAYGSCISNCEQGPSLPLDGGLSILLVLALGSGAVRMFRKK